MTAATSKGSRNGKIVTFYSYKGGTGRSMALANIAWILANCGRRVLAIDWDLEAPGLHRYFEPYLTDKILERSTGLVDFILSFATAAVSSKPRSSEVDWYLPYSNLLAHAVPIQWAFHGDGTLDFVPAGRQDAAYANRVNSFNWQNFYEILGGGVLLESVKTKLRPLYDFILVDSRTGVSEHVRNLHSTNAGRVGCLLYTEPTKHLWSGGSGPFCVATAENPRRSIHSEGVARSDEDRTVGKGSSRDCAHHSQGDLFRIDAAP